MDKKLEELRKSIKAALDAAESLIGEGKFDEAKLKQDEADKLAAEATIVTKAIAQRDLEAKSNLEAERDEAVKSQKATEAKSKEAQRLAGLTEEMPVEEDAEVTSAKAVNTMRYGDITSTVKAVIADLYGSSNTYSEMRRDQMSAFVKYLRFGESRLNSKEAGLLDASNSKNFLIQPEVISFEIKSGRSVGEIKATLVESSNELGGYLVPEDYRAEIIKRLMGTTVVRKRARVITTTRDAVEWPRLEGGNNQYTSAVRMTWVEETPLSLATTNPTFGMLRIPIYTSMARTDVSRNLLEDSAFNLLDVLAGLFSEAMQIDEETAFLTGTGGGTPTGILSGRSGAEVTPGPGIGSQVTGNATAITADGIFDQLYSVASQYRAGSAFVGARLTVRDVRKLKDGNGRYLWQDSLQLGQPANLAGFPFAESESMPAIAANSYPLIFGDFGGYIIADRVGMTVERVSDSTLMAQNKVAIFARRRLGGAPAETWRFSVAKVSV